jgi:hypothetical protein
MEYTEVENVNFGLFMLDERRKHMENNSTNGILEILMNRYSLSDVSLF